MGDKRKHFEEGFCADCAKTFNNKIERLRAELAEVKARNAFPCTWTEDEDGSWETACDHLHLFYGGGPVENEYIFCPYCGQKIKERRGDG